MLHVLKMKPRRCTSKIQRLIMAIIKITFCIVIILTIQKDWTIMYKSCQSRKTRLRTTNCHTIYIAEVALPYNFYGILVGLQCGFLK